MANGYVAGATQNHKVDRKMRNKQLPLDLKATSLTGRFDIKRDIAIEKAGGIFCQACLTGRTDLSPDPRYCQRCYDFLMGEGELLQVTRPGANPPWLPKGSTSPQAEVLQAQRHGHNSAPTISRVPDKSLIMSTSKRGPKYKVLPWDLIIKLADEGMSPQAIATRLYAGQGLKISYKTIERKLRHIDTLPAKG